jgi:O6-methylguanine-DNA--protein-cysteine methyltransferase
VIGSTGDLTGFAGGLEAKAHLLGLEGARIKTHKKAA